MNNLFNNKLIVLNEGLESFSDNINQSGAQAIHIKWQPPANGDKKLGIILAHLLNNPEIDKANKIAFNRYLSAKPSLIDIMPAKEAIPELSQQKKILHAGPPIAWESMCGPMQGAIIGAMLYEGFAISHKDAEQQLNNHEVELEPCHHLNAVGPMSGIISPSMPVWVVENEDNQQKVFCNLNEGLGKVLRFGANSCDVITRLKWIENELAPALKTILQKSGPIELKPIIAQALHMGDEVHNRNTAASAIFLKKITDIALQTDLSKKDIYQAIHFINNNDHFFLNLSMAACKCMLAAAENVKGSTMVTTMARNGVNFAIRLSGTGNKWFQAPANPVNGLFFPGYDVEDAAPDLGDSAITETAGIGGFAMASSPAIVKFVGGTPADAIKNSLKMQKITIGQNQTFTLPALNFSATAAGIDARKVVDSSILPIINTGIAHKKAGIGQIGAGITTAPMPCFYDAIQDIYKQLNQ